MSASVIKFEFRVQGQSKEECIEAIDKAVLDLITKEGGEPWVRLAEKYEMVTLNQTLALTGDPNGFTWVGDCTVLFAGPTKISFEQPFRDGFRPQAEDAPPTY